MESFEQIGCQWSLLDEDLRRCRQSHALHVRDEGVTKPQLALVGIRSWGRHAPDPPQCNRHPAFPGGTCHKKLSKWTWRCQSLPAFNRRRNPRHPESTSNAGWPVVPLAPEALVPEVRGGGAGVLVAKAKYLSGEEGSCGSFCKIPCRPERPARTRVWGAIIQQDFLSFAKLPCSFSPKVLTRLALSSMAEERPAVTA